MSWLKAAANQQLNTTTNQINAGAAGEGYQPVGSTGGAVFDRFGGDRVWMSTARMATSPTMKTNMPAAPKRQKKCINQPKTRGLDGGEARYEAQLARGAVGARVDHFRVIKLSKKLKQNQLVTKNIIFSASAAR